MNGKTAPPIPVPEYMTPAAKPVVQGIRICIDAAHNLEGVYLSFAATKKTAKLRKVDSRCILQEGT